MQAIHKLENVDLNSKYVADVEDMILEQSIGHGNKSESFDSSGSFDSSNSD